LASSYTRPATSTVVSMLLIPTTNLPPSSAAWVHFLNPAPLGSLAQLYFSFYPPQTGSPLFLAPTTMVAQPRWTLWPRPCHPRCAHCAPRSTSCSCAAAAASARTFIAARVADGRGSRGGGRQCRPCWTWFRHENLLHATATTSNRPGTWASIHARGKLWWACQLGGTACKTT
jgi:hypothetical protein